MSLRMAALGLITQHPGSSGYDLLKMFDLSLANVWPATQSQLYGELNRLRADGLIETHGSGPRGRKEYTVTDQGRAALRTWLLDEPTEASRSAGMLKVFLLSQVDPAEASDFLRSMAAGARAERDQLRTLHASINWGPEDATNELMLDWGIQFYGLQAQWAERAERFLAQRRN